MPENRNPNRLIHSTSPYLLQHAYNPVDWYEWSNEAFEKATREDKPVLVSIGYSSCHWCHVMERECFENHDIAAIMNDFFVCIKIDREERPDIDQIYMEAVQAMGINGGWPLNVFLTAQQKPFYGGTYFPPKAWVQVLTNIHKVYSSKRTAIEQSATELGEHLLKSDINRFRQESGKTELKQDLDRIYQKLQATFDTVWGGMDKAPKFVMPSLWLFLLRYYHITQNTEVLAQILLTLRRIAMGGIYDQVGGGFARYSVDAHWFVPHFEKMLYDNAQLMSLFAEAYAVSGDDEFKKILHETFEWLTREMTSPEGGFYSALDADSEGVEGKFYTWTSDEVKSLLKDDHAIIMDYFSMHEKGNWEHGNNILIRNKSDSAFLREKNISAEDWESTLSRAKKTLLDARENRIRPGLDDKIITAWNGMMITGLVDAYKACGDTKFLNAALANANFLNDSLSEGNTLYRSYKGKRSHVTGFLDDYAFLIQAYIRLYQATFDESWLFRAQNILQHTLDQFLDIEDGFFFYTGTNSEKLITRKKEVFDNVIPSSNSVMAQNLFHLGLLLDKEDWKDLSIKMAGSLAQLIKTEPNYMSNWAIVHTEVQKGLAEVVFVGKESKKMREKFEQSYEPFSLTMGTETKSDLPLITGKQSTEPTIYVCYNKTCKLPVHSVHEAKELMVR